MVRIGLYEVKTDLLYWDNYLWIERIADTELRIGVTDFGQKTLKDIIAVQLPAKGERLHKKSILFTVESISRDYEANSPVSCIVLNINEEIQLTPELLNDDPFKNWIVSIECLDLKDLDLLIDGDDMADLILEETGGEETETSNAPENLDEAEEDSAGPGNEYYNDKYIDLDKDYDADDEYGFTPSEDDW